MSTKISLNEINKQLERKDLDPKFKASLKEKRDILTNNKIVKK